MVRPIVQVVQSQVAGLAKGHSAMHAFQIVLTLPNTVKIATAEGEDGSLEHYKY